MAAAAPAWKVAYQQPKVGLGGDGRAVEGIEVGFVTAGGVHSHVFVPRSRFNADTVKAAIVEWVARHDAVGGLSG